MAAIGPLQSPRAVFLVNRIYPRMIIEKFGSPRSLLEFTSIGDPKRGIVIFFIPCKRINPNNFLQISAIFYGFSVLGMPMNCRYICLYKSERLGGALGNEV